MNQESNRKHYASLEAFYPFYIGEHGHGLNRLLHFCGTCLGLCCFAFAAFSNNWWILFLAPVIGYTLAWIGHFGIEKNRPATFAYPLYSFLSDWIMWWQLLTRQRRFFEKN